MCFTYEDQDIIDSCKIMHHFIQENKDPKVILDKLLDEFYWEKFLFHFGWTDYFEYKITETEYRNPPSFSNHKISSFSVRLGEDTMLEYKNDHTTITLTIHTTLNEMIHEYHYKEKDQKDYYEKVILDCSVD